MGRAGFSVDKTDPDSLLIQPLGLLATRLASLFPIKNIGVVNLMLHRDVRNLAPNKARIRRESLLAKPEELSRCVYIGVVLLLPLYFSCPALFLLVFEEDWAARFVPSRNLILLGFVGLGCCLTIAVCGTGDRLLFD